MNEAVGLPVQRTSTLKFNWQEFAAGVAETAGNAILKGWADGGVSAFVSLTKAIASFSVETPPPARVWALNVLAFAAALDQVKNPSGEDHDLFKSSLRDSLNKVKVQADEGGYIIPSSFLNKPTSSPIYIDLRDAFVEKHSVFQTNPRYKRETLCYRLDAAFDRAVYQIWMRSPDDYRLLRDALESPGLLASERRMEWLAYSAYLRQSFEVTPAFGQEKTKVSLSELYIGLRAFWNQRDADGSEVDAFSFGKNVQSNSNVLLLDDALDDWLNEQNSTDRIRLIGGGPGSGKSTSLKAFVSRATYNQETRILFVPLQHIGIDSDLRDSINKYFTDRTFGYFTNSPLSRDQMEDSTSLLLIFDGLDELIAPNEAAADAINLFVSRLNTLLATLRGDGEERVKVAVSGRMPAFQAARKFLAIKDEACLEVFGYSRLENSRAHSKDQLWQLDQRDIWWKKYAEATGLSSKLPKAIKARELKEITHEPLLCYLLVVSGFATSNWKAAADNINRIYASLMQEIHSRSWGEGEVKRHGAGRSMDLKDFDRLMRSIGLAAWLGGDTRVASEEMLDRVVALTRAGGAWREFKRQNGEDITNLAMNFYLKSAEGSQRGCEFTHKSFGEYLAALALIDLMEDNYDLVSRRIEYAKAEWFKATATGSMSKEILDFMRREIRLRLGGGDGSYKEKALAIHAAISEMLDDAGKFGFDDTSGGSWRSSEQRQLSSEEALWAIGNAYARAIAEYIGKDEARFEVPSIEGFGLQNLLARHVRAFHSGAVIKQSLDYLKAGSLYLFYGALDSFSCVGMQVDSLLVSGYTFINGTFSNTEFGAFNCSMSQFYHTTLDFTIERSASFDSCVVQNVVVGNSSVKSASVDIKTYMASDITFEKLAQSFELVFDRIINLDKYNERASWAGRLNLQQRGVPM